MKPFSKQRGRRATIDIHQGTRTNSMTCALSPTGVSCWGDGILGDGSSTAWDIPSTVRFF